MNAGHAIAGLLLLANLVLLSLVGIQSRAGTLSAYTPAALTPLKAQINQERRRVAQGSMSPPGQASAPAKQQTQRRSPPPEYLLAGIDGFVGQPCPALDEFLVLMETGITEAGGTLPDLDRGALLAETSCTIDDPKVNRALRRYRRAWIGAGLEPLSPFRHLGKKP